MKNRIDLPAVEMVDAMQPEALPALIAELAALQARAAARMVLTPAAAPLASETAAETLLNVREAAARIGMSPSWLYRNAGKLPFTKRVGARTLRFSEAGIRRYQAARHGGRA